MPITNIGFNGFPQPYTHSDPSLANQQQPQNPLNPPLPSQVPGADLTALQNILGIPQQNLNTALGYANTNASPVAPITINTPQVGNISTAYDQQLMNMLLNPSFGTTQAEQDLLNQAYSGRQAQFNSLGIGDSPGAQAAIAAAAAPALVDYRNTQIANLLGAQGQDINKQLGIRQLQSSSDIAALNAELNKYGLDINQMLGIGGLESGANQQAINSLLGFTGLEQQGAGQLTQAELDQRAQDINQRAQDIGFNLGLSGQTLQFLMSILGGSVPQYVDSGSTSFGGSLSGKGESTG